MQSRKKIEAEWFSIKVKLSHSQVMGSFFQIESYSHIMNVGNKTDTSEI